MPAQARAMFRRRLRYRSCRTSASVARSAHILGPRVTGIEQARACPSGSRPELPNMMYRGCSDPAASSDRSSLHPAGLRTSTSSPRPPLSVLADRVQPYRNTTRSVAAIAILHGGRSAGAPSKNIAKPALGRWIGSESHRSGSEPQALVPASVSSIITRAPSEARAELEGRIGRKIEASAVTTRVWPARPESEVLDGSAVAVDRLASASGNCTVPRESRRNESKHVPPYD